MRKIIFLYHFGHKKCLEIEEYHCILWSWKILRIDPMKTRILKTCLGLFLFIGLVSFCSSTEKDNAAENLFSAAEPVESDDQPINDRQLLNDEINQTRQNAITRAVARISPAVAGINVTQIRRVRERSLFEDDPFWGRFYRPREYSQKVKSLGSGFIISPNGYILTNEHVVHQASEIVVTLTDGKQYQAQLIGEDYKNDVALLKIEGENLPYIPLGNSDDVIIGEWIIAFGNPFGLFDINTQPTVTVGVVSSIHMNFGGAGYERSYQNMIQTDAAINSGNSGGPLVNSEGKCIGINSFIISGSDYKGTSIGLGFAIPINYVKQILPDLKNQLTQSGGAFQTGLEVENISWLVAAMLGIAANDGVIVSQVEKNSPAERAGLAVGDVVVTIDGQRVRSTTDVQEIINRIDLSKAANMRLTLYRKGKLYKVDLEMER